MNAITALVAADASAIDGRIDGLPGRDAVVQVGLIRLWDRDLAIPAAFVREVVPCPPTLQPAFPKSDCFVGTVVIREQVVPVVDVSILLGFSGEGDAPKVIVVLRHDDELMGLLVHSVLGLMRIRARDIQPFVFPASADIHLVVSSFAHKDRLIGIIDTAVMTRLPGVPRVPELPRKARDETLLRLQKVLMLSIAGAELALDAPLVVATLPTTHIRPAPPVSEDWVGVINYLGMEVPVIDDLALFGLSGRAADGRDALAIILRLGEGRLLAMKADRVRRIISVHPRDIRPLPPLVAQQLPFFAGSVADGAGGQSLLLRSQSMMESSALQTIAALTRNGPDTAGPAALTGGEQVTAGDAPCPQPFLVFTIAEGRRACLLADIAQIIPLPQEHSRLSFPGSSLRGLASHGDGPLTLVHLGNENPPEPGATDTRMVLVVKNDQSATGFIVDGLETIARTVIQAVPPMMHQADDADTSFIQVTIRGKSEAVRLCQLEPGPHYAVR